MGCEEEPPVIQAAGALGSPDGRFAVLQNTHISPMTEFRTYFPFVTSEVTRLADQDICVSDVFRTDFNTDNERLRLRTQSRTRSHRGRRRAVQGVIARAGA